MARFDEIQEEHSGNIRRNLMSKLVCTGIVVDVLCRFSYVKGDYERLACFSKVINGKKHHWSDMVQDDLDEMIRIASKAFDCADKMTPEWQLCEEP